MNVVAPEKVVLKRGASQAVEFTIQVKTGYHVNSNKPEDEYLIPLRFTFTGGESPVQVGEIEYPKPSMEKLAFSTKPVSVFQGDIRTKALFKAGPNVPPGVSAVQGKLRYQACNDRMCLPPRTLDVKIPVEIRN
ncbi:MAG: protein-disulfide reductase DsbD family protein [Bryobacteraceae bacterium]|nr:protein-disulfide reductase DsbD family protein [Bryobacteraceae bacterium]